jgi:predicted enzyme related to lactoylglutathione lyase
MNHGSYAHESGRPGSRGLRRGLFGLGAVVLVTGLSACSGSIEVPAINPTPTGDVNPGQVVWHEIVTPDVAASQKFYGGLFGWTFRTIKSDGFDYSIAMFGPRPIAGFLRPENWRGRTAAAEWVQFFSVADVDAALERVTASGGTVIGGPENVPQRGRMALAEDTEGAPFGVLRSTSGDPDDTIDPPHNNFMWNELWTNDMGAAARFYDAVIGLESEVRPRQDGDYLLFSSYGRRRAGGFRIPQANIEPTWLPTVRVSDIKATVAKARQLGGEIVLEPRWDVVDGRVAIIADPQGAAVTVRQWEGSR